MANTLQKIVARVALSYHHAPRKIAILLQNQGTTANGFVQLAPRKSEFFSTPSQEFDYQDWLNSLAVHELRHVVQFDKLTDHLRAPLFEELALAIFGITLPPWFYEGDAVAIETVLTRAGRGRQPEFDLVLRTNTLSGRRYSYSKDYLGSARDLPPGYYPLGYFMTTKLRRDYGPFILDSVLTRIRGQVLRPYNLSSSIKHFTGLSTRALHDSTIADLQRKWSEEQRRAQPVDYPVLNRPSRRGPMSYYLPVKVDAQHIAALKQGKGQVPTLVLVDENGGERSLTRIGAQEDYYFRYAAGKFVWDERRSDPRFHKRSYSVVMTYDLASGVTRQLTHRSRLFAPALSADGSRIAAIRISLANRIDLVILDERGRELKSFPAPDNNLLQTPAFHASGKTLVCTGVSARGKTLYELDLATGNFRQLLPWQLHLLSKPVYAGDTVIFKSDFSGIDNLFRLRPGTTSPEQITSVKFGAYNPSWDAQSGQVWFNQYQVEGYDIAHVGPNETHPLGESPATAAYIAPLQAAEGSGNVFDSIPAVPFASRPFREAGHLFNFHSLLPFSESNSQEEDDLIGLKWQSNNLLNTLGSYVAYQYNPTMRTSGYGAGIAYARFVPIVQVTYRNEGQRYFQQTSTGLPYSSIPVTWRQHVLEGNISVPLAFERRHRFYQLGTEIGTNYTQRYAYVNKPAQIISTLRFPLYYRAYAGRNTLTSARDLAPAWGQNVSFLYRHFPFDALLRGELLAVKSRFYLPGIAPNHSLQVSANFQNTSGTYRFTDEIPRAGGYTAFSPTYALRNTLLTGYRFPMAYPDWELGPVAYIKRITGGFFADFENIGKGEPFRPRSIGAEVRADVNFLRFYLPNFQPGAKLIFPVHHVRKKPLFEFELTYNY